MAYDESKLINLGHLKDAIEIVKEHIPEDTDTKVTQTLVSDSVERPILTTPTAQSSTTTTTAAFSTNVKVNASTGNLTATKFTGDGSGLNVGSVSGNAVYTTTSGKLISGSLAVTDAQATTSGTATTFVTSVTEDAKGQISVTKSDVPDMGSATASAAGTKGLVQPTAGSQDKFLRGDNTWQSVITTETQLSKGTTTGSGNAVTDISVSNHQITLTKGETFATKAELDALETAIGSPMHFKGTIGTGGTVTSLPADAKVGDTYKVITDGTYGGTSCKIGDTLICTIAGASQTWVMIPSGDEPSGTVTNIATGSGLTGGPITTTGTISHATTTANAAAAVKVGNDNLGHVVIGDELTYTDVGAAAASHAHGNVTNEGSITATGVDIASGDALAIIDSSASNKIAKTSITFDGSTATKALTQKGTWESFTNVSPAGAISPVDSGDGVVGTSDAYARQDHVHPNTSEKYAVVDSTSVNTAYVATVSNLGTLYDGATVLLYNNKVVNAASATLNINSTGAKPIYYQNAVIPASRWPLGSLGIFVYNTTIVSTGCWIMNYSYGQNTTYSNASLGTGYGTCTTAAATAAKAVTLASYTLATGGYVTVKFTYAVPANATLNVNSKGAKPIFYDNAAIKDGIIQAGDQVTFVYNGTNYYVVGILQEPRILFSTASLTLATSRWSSSGDTTYPYKATINMPGVTENFLPVVQFSDSDTLLYDFSPVSTTGSGTITIMCKTAPTTAITIPQIVCYRGQAVTLS